MNTQEKIDQWKNANLPTYLKEQLNDLNDEQLSDAFYTEVAFGTAGMRGTMGVGTNRINEIVVAQTTLALANHMIKEGVADQGVVISFDSRNNSNLFARISAEVLSANGIPVSLFSKPSPTPELSFAVRYLKTYAGIMITASHNPKEDNGYKIYGSDGGQLEPNAASKIIEERNKVTNQFDIKKNQDTIKMIGEEIDQAYLAQVKSVSVNVELIENQGNELQLAFTPLHGAGGSLVMAALRQAGFTQITKIYEQFEPNGDFPTVVKPNPEDADVFKLAQKTNLPALIAIDPDGDRMGISIKDGNDYISLTGNQIAAIFVDYIVNHKQVLGNSAIVTSNVSSLMPGVIAASKNVATKTVLTGFKWIADQIHLFETEHKNEFLFGFEESYGYLIKPFVRDKDAIQAVLLMSEIILDLQLQNKTILDRLRELYEEFGYFKEKTLALNFEGESGQTKMQEIIEQFRNQEFVEIVGSDVVEKKDYLHLNPSSNLIEFKLADGSWLAIRPSGTEPKLKVYLGVRQTSDEAADKRLNELQEFIKSKV